jgi:hypothetical protein
MGRPWHIFTVVLRGLIGEFLLTLRCVVWAGVIAASRVTLVARKKDATGNLMVATFDTGIRVRPHYSDGMGLHQAKR